MLVFVRLSLHPLASVAWMRAHAHARFVDKGGYRYAPGVSVCSVLLLPANVMLSPGVLWLPADSRGALFCILACIRSNTRCFVICIAKTPINFPFLSCTPVKTNDLVRAGVAAGVIACLLWHHHCPVSTSSVLQRSLSTPLPLTLKQTRTLGAKRLPRKESALLSWRPKVGGPARSKLSNLSISRRLVGPGDRKSSARNSGANRPHVCEARMHACMHACMQRKMKRARTNANTRKYIHVHTMIAIEAVTRV